MHLRVICINTWFQNHVPVSLTISDAMPQPCDDCLAILFYLSISLRIIFGCWHLFDFQVSTYDEIKFAYKLRAVVALHAAWHLECSDGMFELS